METKKTEELIMLIYDRATQFAISKFGKKPNFIRIDEEGLYAVFTSDYGGERDEDIEEISVEDLSADLDTIVQQRKEKEEQERIINEARREKEIKEREQRQKNQRFNEYQKLKKEFE